MTRKSHTLIRSNSYLNMFKPYFNETRTSTYATCPPISLYQKQKLLKEKQSKTSLSQVSTASSLASILQAEWKKSRYNNRLDIDDKQLCLWEDKPSCYNKMIMQRSLPVFEVLPPLNNTDILSLSSNKTFAKLGFTKLFRSIKTCKPSDNDIIFGDSKNLCVNRGWERSRIDWLAKLEGQIHLRRGRRRLLAAENDDEFNNICCFPFSMKPNTFYQYTGMDSNA